MKILSKIVRVPGEVVELDGQNYGFSKDAAGRFFTEVTNADHIGILLAIREAFAIHPDETSAAPAAAAPQAPKAPVQEIPPPVDEIVGDDDEDDDDDKGGAEASAGADDLAGMTIEQLRAEYLKATGKTASDKAPAHILRKTLGKLRAAV